LGFFFHVEPYPSSEGALAGLRSLDQPHCSLSHASSFCDGGAGLLGCWPAGEAARAAESGVKGVLTPSTRPPGEADSHAASGFQYEGKEKVPQFNIGKRFIPTLFLLERLAELWGRFYEGNKNNFFSNVEVFRSSASCH